MPMPSREEKWWHGSNARVFISCGQRPAERKSADRVARFLERRGFYPFLAIRTHSSGGLADEIFRHLETSDYFLFIDFKRPENKLTAPVDPERGQYRGSVFSQQELGVASYLKLPVLPFLEQGVRREGVLDFIAGNPIVFKAPRDLVKSIGKSIESEGWDPGARRELRVVGIVKADAPAMSDRVFSQGALTWYYHFVLQNLHQRLMANDCRIQLEKIEQLDNLGNMAPRDRLDPVELKFTHVTAPVVAIPGSKSRMFDGLVIWVNQPWIAIPGLNFMIIDNNVVQQQYYLSGPGLFRLTYVVYSREFSPARTVVSVRLGRKLDDLRIQIIETATQTTVRL